MAVPEVPMLIWVFSRVFPAPVGQVAHVAAWPPEVPPSRNWEQLFTWDAVSLSWLWDGAVEPARCEVSC